MHTVVVLLDAQDGWWTCHAYLWMASHELAGCGTTKADQQVTYEWSTAVTTEGAVTAIRGGSKT